MNTKTPKWGYRTPSFFPYAPTDIELNNLIVDIQNITAIQSTDDFKETIRRLIILLRTKVDIERIAPNVEEVRAELQQFERAVSNLHNILTQKGLSDQLRMFFTSKMMRYDLHSELDPLYNAHVATDVLAVLCEEVKSDLKVTQKKEHTITKYRDQMLIQFAKALAEVGYTPKATRGGSFQQVVEIFIRAIACKIDNRNLFITFPEDNFKIIRMIVKEYPLSPKLGLLEKGKVYPGLTG